MAYLLDANILISARTLHDRLSFLPRYDEHPNRRPVSDSVDSRRPRPQPSSRERLPDALPPHTLQSPRSQPDIRHAQESAPTHSLRSQNPSPMV